MFRSNPNLRISLAIGTGVGLIYSALIPPGISQIDGIAMLELAESLVRNHNFRVSPETGALGLDGYYYSKWYLLLPMLAVPLVAIGLFFGQIFNLPGSYMAGVCVLILLTLLTAATTSLVVLLALRLGSGRKGAYLAGLGYAFGTIALVYPGTFFTEPLLAFLITISLYWILGKSNKEIIGASLFSGLVILAKPSALIIGPILSVYLITKKFSLAAASLPLISTTIFTFIYGIYNFLRFGNPFSFGQSWINNVPSEIVSTVAEQNPTNIESIWGFLSKFAVPVQGIFGLLVSPGRGLLWYSPVVILSLIGFIHALKKNRLAALLIVALFSGFLLIHSGSWWTGGWSWGPRYLLPVLPGLLALAALMRKPWLNLLLALTIIGFLVNAPTRIAFYDRYFFEAKEQRIPQDQLLWSFEYAPFRHGWSMASHQVSDAAKSDVNELVTSSSEKRYTRVIAMWWWMLPVAGISRGVGILAALILIGIGVWMIRAGALCI
jgi:hypothetical protein